MGQVKKRIFAGAVCDQITYQVSDRGTVPAKERKAKVRFENPEDRAEFNRLISRRQHARRFNATFSPASIYSTLTFDVRNEIHDFDEARRIRDNYIRRLKYKYPEAQIAIYMGRGGSTDRIHFHMVSNGVPEKDIIEKWGRGEIRRIVHLRENNTYNGVNCGQDYTGLANYLFDHWTAEQGGHRYKMTTNCPQPEEEKPTECVRNYSPEHPPKAPKGYILVSIGYNKYGYACFHYVRTPKKKKAKPQE